MSGTLLSSAMMKAYKEGLGVDFALICQGVTKQVHSQVQDVWIAIFRQTNMSQVIMARSPYLEAKVNRWCKEKKELVIEDCDLVTFNVIVDYMYGIAIPDSVRINANVNTEEDSVPTAKKRKLELGVGD